MFNSANATKNIAATARLDDGTILMGSFVVAMSSDLPRTLNGDGSFVEFETSDGERSFLAKSSIAQAIPTDIPKVKKLDACSDSDGDFNPYRVLKIKPGSDMAVVKEAYYKRAKMYHPDRFAGADLPEEMARYAQNMARLINAAFKQLSLENQAAGAGADAQQVGA